MAVRNLLVTVATTTGLFVASACGGGPVPRAPDPPDFDPKVVFRDLAKGSSRPMVVDWSPDERASLESRAARGAILVRITENGIEPLWDCTLANGSRYEFTGVSPKRDHVDARSDAELAANFPMGFAKLRSYLKAGQAISADIRMIGVAELNRISVRRSDLPPHCATATHFVKELTIGGFQFGSAAMQAAGAGAGFGNAGADGGYAGIAHRLTEEGDFRVCESADPESRAAPARCKGILRIRLVPIDQDATQVQETTCGAGMRWDGRKCVQVDTMVVSNMPGPNTAAAPVARPAFECRKDDVRECVEQCKRGNAASCTWAGNALVAAKQASIDDLKTLYGVACKGQHWEGCSNYANILQYEQKDTEATTLFGAACLGGFSGACTNYGVAVYFGRGGTRQDRALAFKLWERACRLGDFTACSNAGVVINKGEGGLRRDTVGARRLFEVACVNGDPGGCANLGQMFEMGEGAPRDLNEAFKLYVSACEKNNASACVGAGLLLEENFPKDRQRRAQALALYEKACNMETVGDGCASSAETRRLWGHVYNEDQIQRRSCDGSTQSELGCFNAAVVYADPSSGFQNRAKMLEFASRACKSAGAQKEICRNFR